MKRHLVLLCWLLLIAWLEGAAAEASSDIRATTLMETTTSWDGKPIVYPKGQAEVTAKLVELAPGALTEWHEHPVPSFAYVMDGTLELKLDDGRVKRVKAGEAFVEVMSRAHAGRSVGASPLRLVMFFAGAVGTQVSDRPK